MILLIVFGFQQLLKGNKMTNKIMLLLLLSSIYIMPMEDECIEFYPLDGTVEIDSIDISSGTNG
ncbi:hypothetical protein UFOVP97_5 [uncultured Caudovirales phage]|uniref:Uncharacterized protein n=1 Tax=uncultured Caudovirales phage TaxID=2100421 RepID=A0A6J5LJ11_9CAUD|nr:hypothetical protein UFOVP97_5 [uncultured Caudovirales phage]CAB4134155.1 hypothetical protein UFOVP268_23 [uncultured Caudovirales phage]